MTASVPVRVGELEEMATSLQRNLLPFQSLRQVLWSVGSFAIVMLAGYAFDVTFDGGRTSLRGWLFIGVGALAGGMPAWRPLLPLRFRIATEGPVAALSAFVFVKEMAVVFGYRRVEALAEGIMLSTLRFRWLGGKENRVSIRTDGNVVSVTGPAYAIRRFHRRCVLELTPSRHGGNSSSSDR